MSCSRAIPRRSLRVAADGFAAVWLGVWLGLAAGCRSTAPPSPTPYAAREVVERQRWQVRSAAQLVGTLVELEIRDPAGPVVLYQVLDGSGRLAGSADGQRRFGKRVPFQEQEQPLGAWSLAAGAARVLGVSGPVELLAEGAPAAPAHGRGP
jgi:hypothetical protein